MNLSNEDRRKISAKTDDVGNLCEDILDFLKGHKVRTLEEIAEHVKLPLNKIEELMISLEDMSLVEREVKISITETGKELLKI